jgi:glycosyltransferase involved in cell wall biosynthesis
VRFHVVSLPHTQTTDAYSACAFTEKVRKFCIMMHQMLGHEVFLYAGEQNDAPCTEHICCISEAERAAQVGTRHYTQASFNFWEGAWVPFNENAAREIRKRALSDDFICVIGGRAHQTIADALPHLMCVEFGIGYGGTFAKYRVFESYAWMHTIYGNQCGGNVNAATGNFFDAVIPGYFEVERFPFVPPERVAESCGPFPGPRGPQGDESELTEAELKTRAAEDERLLWEQVERHRVSCNTCREKDGLPPWKSYYLFIGRVTPEKGWRVAVDACKRAGKKLVIAGQANPPEVMEIAQAGCTYAGVIGPKERGGLMAGAIATFVPTCYIEPFGNVAVESMGCGTPVITTDWGAMTETVIDGVTGFRCRMMQDFLEAMEKAKTLDPHAIRKHAIDNYSLGVISKKYERYFQRLSTLQGVKPQGFYGSY